MTTDISHRGPGPESPAPLSMPLDAPEEAGQDREIPRMDGGAGRATVTPSAGDPAAAWRAGPDGEQDRFDRPEAAPSKPRGGRFDSSHVRMLPILLSVVIGALLLVGLAIGIVWLISKGSGSSFNVSIGDCVKKSGTVAVKASCGDAGAYQIVSIVDNRSQCADAKQPYVLNPTKGGKTQILCLKPGS